MSELKSCRYKSLLNSMDFFKGLLNITHMYLFELDLCFDLSALLKAIIYVNVSGLTWLHVQFCLPFLSCSWI